MPQTTYSQVPIRCQRRPYNRAAKSPFKQPTTIAANHGKTKGTRSCLEAGECTPTFRIPVSSRCKKSLSMIDLSPVDPEIGDLKSDSSSSVARLEDVEERATEFLGDGGNSATGIWTLENNIVDQDQSIGKAAGLVCHTLVVNAWRRRRQEVDQLHETIKQLGQQVDHLHIQIVVLRRLLETENSRVGKLNAEVHRVKVQLDDVSKERDTLRTEKEKVENDAKELRELSEQRTVTAENLRNELMSTQSQLHALDAQMTRDREKLLKLRDDKKILLDKVTACESLAAAHNDRAEKAESAVEELEMKLAGQVALVETAQEQIHRYSKELAAKEEERLKLEQRLWTSEEAGRALSLGAANLESQLSDREAALRRLESAYTSQMMELCELKERIARQSQESGWSSRVLQIAGSVVRAPRAILRTLSFLSSTGSPMTS
ncbi:autophagy-related protein 23 isoform X2 [Cephus cinctus]|uniref:Autophagy-related protein 23 isoform X2 n=1 Tax=Cephus cinctus TaxID=211228 RepID=A0AAJ7RT19_CEPCN|nr:autophagy-related protein 23 isoform X2 [Cephus cinctus]